MLLCRWLFAPASGLRTTASVCLVVATLAAAPGVSEAQTFRDTGLGDSIAFGLWAPVGQGYVYQYKRHVEADTGVSLQLYPLGVPGWSSRDLLDALLHRPLFRLTTFFSEVVTWNIGGNDLRTARSQYKARSCGGADNQQCLRDTVASLKANWDGIISAILSLRRGRPTVIRTTDIYNPYVTQDQNADTWPADAGTDFQVLNPYLNEVNAYIAASSAAGGIQVAAVHAAFNGVLGNEDPAAKGYIAFDGFHPNAEGHRVIANLLRGLGYAATLP
jgi:lysophospholipase L1-like esterase